MAANWVVRALRRFQPANVVWRAAAGSLGLVGLQSRVLEFGAPLGKFDTGAARRDTACDLGQQRCEGNEMPLLNFANVRISRAQPAYTITFPGARATWKTLACTSSGLGMKSPL